MKKEQGQKIVIIGCGNLAWHLAKHFTSLKKFRIFVYNHAPNKALPEFKNKLKCTVSDNIKDIITDANFYFICVPDRSVSKVSRMITAGNSSLILHTAGSKNIKEIIQQNRGVFYPLQTFSKNDSVNWKETPLLIEASDKNKLKDLEKLAGLFTKKIIHANSAERLKIHLAAVMVNNFTNALYTATDSFLNSELKNEKLNFKLLFPLIKQTTLKLDHLEPLAAQTGPAKRKDKEVMKEHLHLLKNKELKKIYKLLSALIYRQQTNSHA